jgi:hypothetical protein
MKVKDTLPFRRVDCALELGGAHGSAEVDKRARDRSNRNPIDQDPILVR